MKNHLFIICLLSGILLFSHCDNNKSPDVSTINVDLHAVRYDTLLYAIDTNNVKEGLLALSAAHPLFTEVFTQDLTGWGIVNDTSTIVFNSARHYLTYKDYVNLQKTVLQKFPDTKKQDAELKKMFQYIKYYLPQYKIPKLYYFNSGLNIYSAITFDTLIGVGLDMYLGADFEFYPSVQLPKYQIARCTPEYIAPNVASNVYRLLFPFDNTGKNMLQSMIARGKEMYFLDQVLSQTEDSLKIGYTAAQLKWCEDNEKMIWNYFAQNNLLYSTEMRKYLAFVADGPSSQGFPSECPGNIGTFIGWQIVKDYCKKNPPKSLEKFLMEPIAEQDILTISGYKGN
jgi:hypothetical protein